MRFQIKKILTDKQVRKAKWSIVVAALVCAVQIGTSYYANATPSATKEAPDGADGITYWERKKDSEDAFQPWEMKTEAKVDGKYQYKREDGTIDLYDLMEIDNYATGRIVKFSNQKEVCTSGWILPGTDILPIPLLAIAYFITLCWLFLGISIVADIFMASIEKITSQTRTVIVKNADGSRDKKTVLLWNPTVANLSLMALGSSAPEILLNVLETTEKLTGCPGELGPSTIVGSAAFNLLCISGLSILAVTEENDTDPRRDQDVPVGVKKIYDMGVFSITSSVSIFAYLWLWICLVDQNISTLEATLTFAFFWILLITCYAADRYKAAQERKKEDKAPPLELFQHNAVDFYRTLLADKEKKEDQEKVKEMKDYLRSNFGHDQIERIELEELKKKVEGEGMLARAKYRRNVQAGFTGKRPAIAKGEVMRAEHEHAEFLEESSKNASFGFNCLHYSVSEASGQLRVMVLNKTGDAARVRVVTIDDAAKAGEDYEAVDTFLQFAKGEKQKFVEVVIKDDDSWEPDEDFFMQLYDADTGDELEGKDTRTRITIIDDDKPGAIYFQESKNVQADASLKTVSVIVERRNGSDGTVTVDYKTSDLDETANTATAGVDYVAKEDTLTFLHGQVEKEIVITILPKEGDEPRDESFLVQLSNVTPAGAKLSKKSYMVVNIVTDAKQKKQQEALAQLLKKIEEEEEITWSGQIINACMCHPTKNEDGDIEDVEPMTAFIHFASIFWKLIYFAACPPPHYMGGWACFICSLTMIGVATKIVAEFANLVGCTMGLKPTVTAITFVALGTSLPDTFASMTAAVQDRYADPALGNVTGSNAVNVFLGLGLPWLIACLWEQGHYPQTFENNGYYIEAGALGFSVIVFTVLAITCIIFIVARRYVVGGELGGSKQGRTMSCIFLCTLWLIYIILSTLQAYQEEIGMRDMSFLGMFTMENVHRLEKCWSDKQIKGLKEAQTIKNKDGGDVTYPAYNSDAPDGKSLYEQRQGISTCIRGVLKARKSNPDTEYPVDGTCGTPL